MIAAAQRADVAGLLEAASMLIGADALGDALGAAQNARLRNWRDAGFISAPRTGAPCTSDLCPKRTLH